MATQDQTPITASEIDESFVPCPAAGLRGVTVGDELVLLDGWTSATTLNHVGSLIWTSFDGEASVAEIARELSDATGADLEVVLADVLTFAQRAAADRLLEGIVSQDDSGVELVGIPDLEVGEEVPGGELQDLDGHERTLADFHGREALLVHWSPHCGYCGTIADLLGLLVGPLDDVGVQLVLISAVDAEANRNLASAVGLTSSVLVRGPEVDPFIGHGTPCAYRVDAAGRLLEPIIHGSEAVLATASRLAGVDPVTLLDDSESDPVPAGTRYLLADDGECRPLIRSTALATWAGSRAYRLDDVHAGVRFDTDQTAELLDRLFAGQRVRDRRAGYSYGVALAGRDGDDGSSRAGPGGRPLNLLVAGGVPLVRSRYASRVLRSLLWNLSDDVFGYATGPGRIRVQATAVLVGGDAVLLPPGWQSDERLQPLLARRGMTLVDLQLPEIDLEAAELVVPEPRVDHDRAVLEHVDGPITSRIERPPLLPGRYPLIGWGVVLPGDHEVVDLSPAEAAAATLSRVYEADDAPARLRELGELFTRIRGFGIWYGSEAGFADAVALAVSGRSEAGAD